MNISPLMQAQTVISQLKRRWWGLCLNADETETDGCCWGFFLPFLLLEVTECWNARTLLVVDLQYFAKGTVFCFTTKLVLDVSFMTSALLSQHKNIFLTKIIMLQKYVWMSVKKATYNETFQTKNITKTAGFCVWPNVRDAQ